MPRKVITFLMLFCGSGFIAGLAAGARFEVRLDRDQARVGEPIDYTLRVEAAEDESVVFPEPAGGRIGKLEINHSLPDTARDGVREKKFVLQGFEAGSFTLPGPEVTVRKEDGEEMVLAGPELEIEIISVLGDEGKDTEIRELKDPIGLPRSYRWIIYLLSGAAVLFAIAYLLYRKFFRRGPVIPPLPTPRPAGEIAREELERIRKADLPGRGLVKEYYSQVSDTVRRYLENRFSLKAPERTTEEFLQEMATTSHLTGEQQNSVGNFLAESDLVKFARYGPTEKEIAQVFAAAVRLVEETEEGELHRQGLHHSLDQVGKETGQQANGADRAQEESKNR